MSESPEKTFKEDGIRPIEDSEVEVADTYEEDGTRPIGKGRDFLVSNKDNTENQTNKNDVAHKSSDSSHKNESVHTYEEDGTRPIEDSEVEIADTFEEDGTRPIGESPDFLLTGDRDNTENKEAKQENQNSKENKQEDNKKSSSKISNSKKVVDTYEEDGTRPIMSNQYEVVDTIDVDGHRPITDK